MRRCGDVAIRLSRLLRRARGGSRTVRRKIAQGAFSETPCAVAKALRPNRRNDAACRMFSVRHPFSRPWGTGPFPTLLVPFENEGWSLLNWERKSGCNVRYADGPPPPSPSPSWGRLKPRVQWYMRGFSFEELSAGMKVESEQARLQSIRNERERLIEQIRQSERTIEHSRELLKRLDELLAKAGQKR
jgi:hypothetical protein